MSDGCGAAVEVELLADRPDLVEPLARIRWTDWNDEPGREHLAFWVDGLRMECGRDAVPVAFVAVDGAGKVVGGVSLTSADLTEAEGRGRAPWVNGMIVRADRRDAGVGTALMRSLTQWAGRAGIDRAWVVTGGRAVDFYRRCGWSAVETVVVDDGEEAVVLSRTFDAG